MSDKFEALMRDLEPLRKTDPLRYLQAVAQVADLQHAELRFVRAEVLHALAMQLQAAAKLCGFEDEIVVRPQGIFIDVGGVLMESSRTGIYLKSTGARQPNQAAPMCSVLRRFGIDVATAVDVGANFGEISLGLAREFPAARIVAIEPSGDNAATFTLNQRAQNFAVSRVELVQVAVSDKAGKAVMRRGDGAMSRVTAQAGADEAVESVNCERLDMLFDRLGIGSADFVKIDIEGGEPKLREAIVALAKRVRAYYIEFSQFAPFDDYLGLASALRDCGYACYDAGATSQLNSVEEIARHLRAAFAAGPIAVTNLWFVGAAAAQIGR